MNPESHHAESNAQKWDRRAKSYDNKWLDFMRLMQKHTIDLLPLKQNISILDIGCGTGWAIRYIASHMNQSGEFYGVDISPAMIEKAKESSAGFSNMYFHNANAENLPFQDALVDLIICTNSFHHYPHPATALNEIHRVLKPGGRIYITDFTADGNPSRAIDTLFRRREKEHVRFYSTKEYRELFADAKIEYISTQVMLFAMRTHIGEKSIMA